MNNERERFEKYRDEGQEAFTEYAAKYGSTKALNLAAQKTATLQLVIDRYRKGEIQPELPPPSDRTAAEEDTERAKAIARKVLERALEADGEYTNETLLAEVTAALAAGRAPLVAAARRAKSYLDKAKNLIIPSIHDNEPDTIGAVGLINKAIIALAALVEVKE